MSAPPSFTAADFLEAFLGLLPFGRAWPREPGTSMRAALAGLFPVYERNTARAINLLAKEAFPSQPQELLPEWEKSLGLPDACDGASGTVAERQAAVKTRFVADGGQSIGYYVSVAAAMGYAITVQEFAPSRFGRAFGGTFGGDDWAHAWQVTIPDFTVIPFQFGKSRFGEPFRTWGTQRLICVLRRLKPAHTILMISTAS